MSDPNIVRVYTFWNVNMTPLCFKPLKPKLMRLLSGSFVKGFLSQTTLEEALISMEVVKLHWIALSAIIFLMLVKGNLSLKGQFNSTIPSQTLLIAPSTNGTTEPKRRKILPSFPEFLPRPSPN